MSLPPFLIVAAVLAGLPILIGDPYWLHVYIMTCLNIILAASLRVLWNVGLLSCGHAAFMGIGAYTSALLAKEIGLSPWLGMLAGGGLSVVVSVVLGYPALRLTGIYFVLVTFAFNEVFFLIATRWREFTGGPSGLLGIPRPEGIPAGKLAYAYFASILLWLSLIILFRFEQSRVGRIWLAIRDTELRSRCVGIQTTHYKLFAFAVSSFFAGVAGAVYAHYIGFISPTDFTIWQSIYTQIYMIVGGVAAFAGPILGSVVLTVLSEFIRAVGPLQSVVYGTMLAVVMLFSPGGLVSLGPYFSGWFKKRKEASARV
ncbi:MAG TPA: branched-chain amino acid ABC transporter permease [Thermodesulfobacteriota bacterium]|nr:branched-chain amino acid ABC transporter permease [Thermodesulfobacteriota bacterium]